MKRIFLVIFLISLTRCEITESQPFLQVGLENQYDHAGISVTLIHPTLYSSTLTNRLGQFDFDGFGDGEGVIVSAFPFYEPDTQIVHTQSGKIIDWHPVILKQIISIEILPAVIESSLSEFTGREVIPFIDVNIIINNYTDCIFHFASYNEPLFCEVFHCMKNYSRAGENFIYGSFGDWDLPHMRSGMISSGISEGMYRVYLHHEELVPG